MGLLKRRDKTKVIKDRDMKQVQDRLDKVEGRVKILENTVKVYKREV